MRQLVLLRHAKSSWEDPALADFDRPLNGRGRDAAPAMAVWLRDAGLVPDLAICSAARRTLDTWALMVPVFDVPVVVRAEHDLYLAHPDTILQVIHRAGDDVGTLLVLGHNPGLEQAARSIAAGGEEKALRRMRRKFPTGALAVIDVTVEHWSDVGPGSGQLRAFVRPKDVG